MNKKSYITSSLFLFLFIFVLYFCSSLSIFLVSKGYFENGIRDRAFSIQTSLINGESETSITKSYSLINSTRLSFIRDGNIVFDSQDVYSDPKVEKTNEVYVKDESIFKAKYYYFVIFDEVTGYYLRYGEQESPSIVYSFNFLIYGNVALIVVGIIYIIVINEIFKKSLKPLKVQVKKLQKIINNDVIVDYDDDLKYLSLVIRDSRKELQKQIREIKLSEERNKFVLDSFSQGLIVIDSSYKITIFNKKASEIFGLKSEDVIGKNFEILSKAKKLVGNMSMSLHTLRTMIYDEFIDGKVYECSVAPVKYEWNDLNEKNGASLLMIDITDSYNSANMKREFFSNASHELKSPLTSIIGYQEMISGGYVKNKKEEKEVIDRTLKEANRMKKIIYDMLTLSSLENESLRTIEKIDAFKEINNILQSLDFSIKNKNIKVVFKKATFIAEMNIEDFDRLFKNILENAIIYNKEGGSIYIDINKDKKTISIKDEGIGISKENINRVFERFYRVDKSRSRRDGGTGLGLAIVKHISEYYSLKIDIDSQLGEYTTFTITFN